MVKWTKWIVPGLITIAVLSFLAVRFEADRIEADLLAGAETLLAEKQLSWANVTLDGRDAFISGLAPTEADRDRARDLVAGTYDIRVVSDDTALIALQDPYIFTGKKADGKITIGGFAPNETSRSAILSLAKTSFADVELDDQTTLARGAPDGLEQLVAFAFTQLQKLSSGEVTLSGSELSITGIAIDREGYDSILALPQSTDTSGTSIGELNITPPLVEPYVWQATVADNAVKISGFVPDQQSRSVLSNRLAELRPQLMISDTSQLAQGNPQSYDEAMTYAAGRLSQLESGSVTIEGENISVSGVALNSQTYLDAVSKDTSAPPKPYRLATNDVVAPVQSNWSWGLRYNGQLADVSGYVANNTERTSILSDVAAALPQAQIVDGMQFGSGAPENDKSHRDFTIQQLRHLASAEVALDNGTLGVVGVAMSRDGYAEITSALRDNLPEGLALSRMEITPPSQSPHIWSAKRDVSGTTLSGDVSSNAVREGVLQQAGEAFEGSVIDNMQLASGAPDQRPEAREFAFGLLEKMSSGIVTLSNQKLSFNGVASNLDAYDEIQATIAKPLPAGLELQENDISPPAVNSFQWSAILEDSNVTLDGFVPDNSIRADLVSEAKQVFPENSVVDQMRVAASSSTDFGDIAKRSINDLARLSSGSLFYEDGNRRISGVAKSSGDFLFLKRRIDSDPKLNGIVTPPRATGSYNWQAVKTATSIVVSGLVPTASDRQRIAGQLASENADKSIVDRTLLTSGEGPAHISNVDLVVQAMNGMRSGNVGVSDGKISIDGVASSVDQYESLTLEAGKWAGNQSISTGLIDIRPPAISPFTWMIVETEQGITLSGFAPSSDVAVDLAAAASSQLKATVENNQRVAGGAPSGFGRVARILIDAVGRVDSASASLTGERVVLEGKAGSETEVSEIGKRVSDALPDGYRLANRLSYPIPAPAIAPKAEPKPVEAPVSMKPENPIAAPKEDTPEPASEEVSAACPVDFQQILRGKKILFDNNRAFIKASSYPLLDSLVDGFSKCSDARVMISGHTDAVGRDAYNLSLSQSRAQAVLDYIAGKGIDVDAFEAAGFGETKPIADNATDTGRAANRRIVIEVFPAAQ
ncbi:OmpA/MotB [Ahrensia sp. R2A130]|nr:OmpA/MotB [Ahrensia sp. R2A130]